MNKNKTIQLLVIYNEPAMLLESDICTPIHVGRQDMRHQLAVDPSCRMRLDWLSERMIGDDSGDNISKYNKYLCEMTAIYWAWKNYEALGSPARIGFMHYRRHFMFRDEPEDIYAFDKMDGNYLNRVNYATAAIESAVMPYDLIAMNPTPQKKFKPASSSNYEQFKLSPWHEITVFDEILNKAIAKHP